jgi:uncharacterized integral membrane protein
VAETQPRPLEGSTGVGRSRADQARLAVAFALGALVVLFAVLNLNGVQVNWILWVSTTPLIVVIVVCLVLGMAIGWILGRRGRRADRTR